jgi:hypothetical protein
MMAVGCQRAFAARTAVTRFKRHLVADILCEPHETKNLIKIPPFYILLRTRKDFQNNNNNKAKLRPALYIHTNAGKNQYWAIPVTTTITFFWNIAKRDQVGAAPSWVQMMAVGCQRAFAAQTAVTRFKRHLVADSISSKKGYVQGLMLRKPIYSWLCHESFGSIFYPQEELLLWQSVWFVATRMLFQDDSSNIHHTSGLYREKKSHKSLKIDFFYYLKIRI